MRGAGRKGRRGASGSAVLTFQAIQNPLKRLGGRKRVGHGAENLELRVLTVPGDRG